MKTTWLTPKDIDRAWYLIDAEGQNLGRMSTRVASLLIGKSKVQKVPNMDCGDYVIVVNAEKVDFSRKRLKEKMYYRHSGYAGGFKKETLEQLLSRKPDAVIRKAVKNMLPNTKLRKSMYARLMVYSGPDHPHTAQKPEKIEVTSK